MFFRRFGGRRQSNADPTGESGEKLRRLIDGTSQGILVVEASGRALFVNRAGAKMFARREREILDWDSVAPLFADRERDRLGNLFAGPGKNGERAEDLEVRGSREDGATLWLLVQAGIVDWDDGPARLLTITDITARVEAERTLREIKTRFQAILDNTRAMIYLKDLDGRYILANRNVTDLGAEGQIVGRTDSDLNGDATAGAWTANDRRVLETGEACDFEERLRFPDGQVRTYLSTKFPLRRETGEIYAIGGVSNDITLRREMEQALRQSEEKFRNLIDGSIQGVLIHDNPKVIYANAAAAEMLGRSVQDLLGIDVMSIVHPDDRERLDRFRTDRIHGARAPARYQFRGVRQDGETVWLEQIVRVIDWDGQPVYQNTMMNVSVRKRHEELRRQITAQLVHEKERAEDASRTKSTFLASVSHELRTPLNAIIGFSEIMDRQMFGGLSERYRTYAEDIHGSATHLLDLINDILDLSKIEAGKAELFEEEIDVAKLIQTIERIIEPQAREKGISLTCHRPVPLPRIYADDRAVKQILINLVTNAVKFTPAGGEIRLTADLTDGDLTLEVGDTGIGIPAKELALVFEPFRQGAGGHDNQEGTGLGLALVKSLTELHGGAVGIESTPGSGTTVRVTFPADRVVSGIAADRRRS